MAQVKLAIRTSCLKQPLKQALHTAAALGATGIEIDARQELRPADLTETATRQLRKMLDDLNLRVVSVRFHTQRGYDVANDLDRRIDATKAAMQMAYRLGATVVVNQIGRVPAETTDARLAAVARGDGRFGSAWSACRRDVGCGNRHRTGCRLDAVIRSLRNRLCRSGLNPANWIINSIDVSSNLKLVAPRVQLVVARDAVRDLAARRHIEVPLGQGMAEFPELLGVLEDHQYRGWFVVDRSGSDQPIPEVRQAISYLRNL